ncbi:MAG: sugar transferase [Planctomycetota bacterium]|jgi:lipopolysaccharide/colanic/teichoic acid biosynthesis glycosyltransferase
MAKRIFDIIVALFAFVILAVPMLMIALAIRLESRGGAIFRQRRIGRGGKPFTMLKFRTMRADAQPYAASPHSAADQRLTRVGRFIREKSLDELPQLFNVIIGTMSLVGPRPLYQRQAAQWNDRQRRRLEVPPGITGYAQAFGRAGLTIEEKLELDVFYVENISFLLDLKIIARTVANVFSRRGEIYEKRYSLNEEYEAAQGAPPAAHRQETGEKQSPTGDEAPERKADRQE